MHGPRADRPFRGRACDGSRAGPTERITAPSILLVDDDLGTIQLMHRILDGAGELRFATNGFEALRLAREAAPDLVLLDAEMPGMTGFEVCAALKADPQLADIPVIFVTSHNEMRLEVAGFDAGAADFIAKPVSPPLVLARVKTQLRLKRLSDQLHRLATMDGLTGLANRRRFDEALQQEWRIARRNGEPLALVMADVDHFKAYNDHHGHPAGDACLQAVAGALAGIGLRPSDLVARYGGEEFVLLMPHTPRSGALHLAGQALAAVAGLRIPHPSSASGHVSVSAGVACLDAASPDTGHGLPAAQALVAAADQALYAAKRAGRAQVWQGELDPAAAPRATEQPARERA